MTETKVCCLCECSQQVHIYFHECGLFDGGDVCIECAEGIDSEESLKKVNEITGKNITKETMMSMCEICAKRG